MLTPGTKVLLFAEYGRMGGTRTYFKQLLTLYKKYNLAVTIVRTYADYDREIDDLIALNSFDCVNATDIAPARAGFWSKFPFCAISERYAFRHFVRLLRPDVIVASVGTPGLFAGVLGLAGHAVYIVHTYPHGGEDSRHWKGLLRRFIYRHVLLGTALVMTVSEYSGARIASAWGLEDERKPVVVYSTMGEPVERLPVERGHRTILTVGHVVEYKNPYVWIEVAMNVIRASESADISFVWAGDGALLDECRAIVADKGMEQAIIFAGMSNNVELLYRDCSIYFQPSLVESLGLSVLDALRHGKPCVVSSRGGLPEVVNDGECGWVVGADDVGAMTDKIVALLGDDTRYAHMSASAARRYDDVFALSIWEERMIGVHTSAMKANDRRPLA